eukprot:799220-Pyramimonas_sp.AAC.1
MGRVDVAKPPLSCVSPTMLPSHPYVAVYAQEFRAKVPAWTCSTSCVRMHRAPPFPPKARDPGQLSP